MNLIRLFIIIGFSGATQYSMAQSKKEQVELLNLKVDSLNSVLLGYQKELSRLSSILKTTENSVDSLNKVNDDLKKSLNQLNLDLKSTSTKLSVQQKVNDDMRKTRDSLVEITRKPKSFLEKLPKGYSLTDDNGQEGQSCISDIDGDGIEDLVKILYNEEGDGDVVIFLSSTYYTNNTYQYFGWIWHRNYLMDFSCNDQTIHISGGSESQGVFQDLSLIFSSRDKKMVVKSYESNNGETTYDRLKIGVVK